MHKDCPFVNPYEYRQDDGPAECNGVEVEGIEFNEVNDFNNFNENK